MLPRVTVVFHARSMVWRLHSSLAGIGGCLGGGCAQRYQSLGSSRARVLGQRRRAGPRRAARILLKEMLKQHCGEQCYPDKSGASKHSARPGVDFGLFGLGQLNMNMWSHDQFFPSDYRIGQYLVVEGGVSVKETGSGFRNSRSPERK
jgi:hypothetical protein